jgi:hypothetical protein
LPEYDFAFAAVFQRCVSNYNQFVKKHFPEFPLNNQITAFVALSNLPGGSSSTLALNPKNLFQYEMLNKKISTDINEESITQTIKLVSTKKSKDADVKFSISADADDSVHFVQVPKDVNSTHPYCAKEAVKKIKETLALSQGTEYKFTMKTFTDLVKDKGIKHNQEYCYELEYGKTTVKKYSEKLIEFIVYLCTQDAKQQK